MSLKRFLAALFILTFVLFAAAQISREPVNKSEKSNEVNLSFINRTDYPAAIYWVNAGKEKLYKTRG